MQVTSTNGELAWPVACALEAHRSGVAVRRALGGLHERYEGPAKPVRPRSTAGSTSVQWLVGLGQRKQGLLEACERRPGEPRTNLAAPAGGVEDAGGDGRRPTNSMIALSSMSGAASSGP